MNFIKKIATLNKSSKGQIIKSIISLMTSAVMVITVCLAYAWFVNNKDIDSTRLGVGAGHENMRATFTSYYIEDLDTKDVLQGTQYMKNGQYTLDIKLLPYDMTFTATNQYAAVVVRVQIYDLDVGYIPAANQTKYVNLVVTRNTNLSFTTDDELDGYFSSVGQVGCYTNSSLALNADYDDIYSAIMTQYKADQQVMKFTTESNSTYTKVPYLAKSLAYTSANFKTDENDVDCLVLYMCFDYNSVYAQAYAQQESESLENITSLEHRFDILNDIIKTSVFFAWF